MLIYPEVNKLAGNIATHDHYSKKRISTIEFRKMYQIKYQIKALERLKNTSINTAPQVKYITEGPEKFCESIQLVWSNIGLTAALVGAISMTVAVSAPSHSQALVSGTDKLIFNENYINVIRSFYVFWALAALSCLGSVINVTIASIHFNLMVHDDAKLWFYDKWKFHVMELPQVLLVVGCFSMCVGLALGVVIITDYNTYLVVVGISAVLILLILVIWLCMLAPNKLKESNDCLEFKKMIEEIDLYIDPEKGNFGSE